MQTRYSTRPVEERFWAKVRGGDDPNACWEWTAADNGTGYGIFSRGGRNNMTLAHRWAYERWVGPIAAGLTIDHLCRNKRCVNTLHLEAVSHAENVRRGMAGVEQRARTFCPQGHPYDAANTYYHARDKKRGCRTCQRAAKNRWRAKKKLAA